MNRILEAFFVAGAVAAALIGASAPALAGQYVGGDLSLSLNETGNVRILAADVTADGTVGGDVSVLAADVTLDLIINGDAEIAAADVSLSGQVAGDVAIAGADVTIDAAVNGELDLAGADVSVTSRIEGEANIAGAFVQIDDTASFGSEASISGREVFIEGRFEQGVEIRALEVHVSGVVNGAVEIHGRDVYITEGAVLTGPVTVRSPHPPEIAPGAQIGELTHIVEEFSERHIENDVDIDIDFLPSAWAVGGVFAASAFLLGLFVSLLAPKSVGRVAACFRARPWVSGFLGLVVLAVLPVIVLTLFVLLAITVIGLPLAVLLVLAMPIVLFLAFAFGGVVIGDLALNRTGGQAGAGLRILSFFLAFVVIAGLSAVPVLGFFILPAVLCIGLGAWTLAIFQRQSAGAAPAPTEADEAV